MEGVWFIDFGVYIEHKMYQSVKRAILDETAAQCSAMSSFMAMSQVDIKGTSASRTLVSSPILTSASPTSGTSEESR